MQQIRHYSFDLWYTLIRSNPEFKKQRALYFHQHFNAPQRPLDEIEQAFREVDLMCNSINEKTGQNIDAEEMYLMVIYKINRGHEIFESIDTTSLYHEMEKLVVQFCPSVFNDQTTGCLDKLCQAEDNTLNILSNTAFIKGKTLRKVLDHLELSKYFQFQIYSDEVGFSKPHPAMYKLLLEKVFSIRKNDNISSQEIVHIGDNPVADIMGARAAGIQALQINTNETLIHHLFPL